MCRNCFLCFNDLLSWADHMRLGCEPAVFTISDEERESENDDTNSMDEMMTPPWRSPSPSLSLHGLRSTARDLPTYFGPLPSTPPSPATPDKLQMWLDDSSRGESYICSPVAASFSTESKYPFGSKPVGWGRRGACCPHLF